MKYSGHKKVLCELSKLSKFYAINLLGYWTNTDASIHVYKLRPERELQFSRVYATTINFPCITSLVKPEDQASILISTILKFSAQATLDA